MKRFYRYALYTAMILVVLGGAVYLRSVDFGTSKRLPGVAPVDASPLGNQLSAYFYHIGARPSSSTKQNNLEKMSLVQSPTLKNLYEGLDWNLRYNRIDYDSAPGAAWAQVNGDGTLKENFLAFWQNLRPFIREFYNKYLPVMQVDCPVVHFRCGDIPFNKVNRYHIPRAETVSWAAQQIKSRGFNSIIFLSCSDHRNYYGNNCAPYADFYRQIFKRAKLKVQTRCGTLIEDFTAMVYSPLLVSLNSSSFSFMAGISKDPQNYISGNMGVEIYGDYALQRDVDWILDMHKPLQHAHVVDYNNVREVIKQLQK